MDDAIDIILTYSKYVGQYLLDMKLEYDDGKEVKDDTYEIHIQEIKRMLKHNNKMKETVIKLALLEGIYAMFNDYRYRRTPEGTFVDCAKDYKEKYSKVKGMYINGGNNTLRKLFSYDDISLKFRDTGDLSVSGQIMEIEDLLRSDKLCPVLKKLYQTRIIFQKVIEKSSWQYCTVKSNHMEISESKYTEQQLGEDNGLINKMQTLLFELKALDEEWDYFKYDKKQPIQKDAKLKF